MTEIVLKETKDFKLYFKIAEDEDIKRWYEEGYEKEKEVSLLINELMDNVMLQIKKDDTKTLNVVFTYLKIKIFWSMRTITFLRKLHPKKAKLYFLYLEYQEPNKTEKEKKILGFVSLVEDFLPYNCKVAKCKELNLKETKTAFLWYLYKTGLTYEALMDDIYGKGNHSFTGFFNNLIEKLGYNIIWLKSYNDELLKNLYNESNNFFKLEVEKCKIGRLTNLRIKNEKYRCKIFVKNGV